MSTQEELRSFILNILDDDEGISEQAYDSLLNYLQTIGEMELMGEIISLVKSCSGRRYIA